MFSVDDHMSKQALDYIFLLKPKSEASADSLKVVPKLTIVEKMLIEDETLPCG